MAGEAVGRGGSVPPEPERQNPQSEKQNPQSEKQNPQSERQNLLSKRRERRQHRSEGRFPLHRLLVLARPGEGAAAVAGYHRELFEKALEDHWREQVSGLLLVCSSYICHVVESCSSTIHLLIQDLASFQNQGHSALLQEIKVLVVAHDIPSRLFPDWYVAAGTSPPRCPPGSTQPQSAPELAAECLDLLLKLAASVQSSEKRCGLFHLISLHDTGCAQCFSFNISLISIHTPRNRCAFIPSLCNLQYPLEARLLTDFNKDALS
ncbi:testis-expressed protein 47 isoform X2 [Calypte anna]|uniref:testis-expressed protein 47 isoform X2 n=1 Tax=Calypte anna TaxID=9244 RepID=UPI0011C38C7E|nr:testis-expressed protein 47 isoform X2 [Calypte anna]